MGDNAARLRGRAFVILKDCLTRASRNFEILLAVVVGIFFTS
jgi:hypothetical protein